MLILVLMSSKFKILFLFILFSTLFFSCSKGIKEVAVQGVIDISDRSINELGFVSLSGEWEFYWNQLLVPEDFKSGKPISKSYCHVPGSWKIAGKGDESTLKYGCATYRLIVKTNPQDNEFAIQLNRIDVAYKIWINGQFIGSLGETGNSRDNTLAKWGSTENIFTSNLSEQEIIIQVSNYNYIRGGIAKNIVLAPSEKMKDIAMKDIGRDFLLLGIMLIIGLYHLVLFFFRKSVKSSLFFSILSFFACALIVISSNFDIVYLYWPDLSWALQIKLEYSFYYLALLFLILFIVSLFESDSQILYTKVGLAFLVLLAILVGLIPTATFINLLGMIELLFVLVSLMLLFIVIKAVLQRKEGAKHTLVGLSLLSLSIISDVLTSKYSAESIVLFPYGFLSFMLIQAYIISARFTEAISYSELLTEEMDYLNNNLEEIVKDRTFKIEHQKEELTVQSESLKVANDEIVKINMILERQGGEMNKKNRALTDSLNYAKRLQSAVLPDANFLKEVLPEHFIFFQPKDIVSGDFYWYGEVSSWDFDDAGTTQVLIAADCTGHGVPGAFMTLLGHNFLNVTVNIQQQTDPEQIIIKLDQQIIDTLKQNDPNSIRDGMDISVLSIEKEKQLIRYAGAGNPLYYYSKGEFNEIKGAAFGVGGQMRKEKVFPPHHKIEYQPGDVFYIFSDGYPDQIGGKDGRKFYKTRFRELLAEIHTKPMEKQGEILKQQFNDWKGDYKQIDDILVIGIRMD